MRFASMLFRRWYVFLVFLVVFPIVGTIYGMHHLTSYESTAQLFVTRTSQLSSLVSENYNSYLPPNANEASVMNELLQSETFDDQVAANTSLANIYDLSKRAGQSAAFARVTGDTTITASGIGPDAISIAVDDKDPHIAFQIVSALIVQFQFYDQQSHLAADQTAITFYSKQVAAAKSQVQQDLQRVTAYQATHPTVSTNGAVQTDPQYQQLQSQLTQDQSNASSLQSTLQSIQLDEAANQAGIKSITVQDPPQMPLSSTVSKKKLLLYTGGGLGGAIALIVLIVLIMMLLDRKIYSTRDIESIVTNLDLELPAIEALPVYSVREWTRGPNDHRPAELAHLLTPLLSGSSQLLASTAVGQLPGKNTPGYSGGDGSEPQVSRGDESDATFSMAENMAEGLEA